MRAKLETMLAFSLIAMLAKYGSASMSMAPCTPLSNTIAVTMDHQDFAAMPDELKPVHVQL